MAVCIVTHAKRIYRTTALADRLKRLHVPHVVVVPRHAAMVIGQDQVRLVQGKDEITPSLVLNALFNHPGKGIEFIETFEAFGVPVINSAAAWHRAKSKPLTSAYLALSGVPQPECAFSYNGAPLANYAAKHPRALLVSKPWYGSGGKGIFRATGGAMKKRLQSAKTKNQYVQRFVPNSGRDIRVVVVDGTAVGATYRIAPKGRWKTNVSAGGTPAFCEVTPDLAALSVKATRALGLDIAGVDVIEGPDGYVVLEVNAWPDYRIFDRVARVDVAMAIAHFLKKRLRIATRSAQS